MLGVWLALAALVNLPTAQAQWTLLGNAITSDDQGDRAGSTTSLSSDGQTLALGIAGSGNKPGQVKVYTLAGGVWTQLGNTITGESIGDQFGFSVSLSADGQTLAVGAIGYNTLTGQVKVYTWVGGVWTLQGNAILGDATGDFTGNSVSLSDDGQILAVGAPNNNSRRGQVKFYRFCNLPVSITPTSPSLCSGTSLTLTASAEADSYSWSTGETTVAITVSPTSTTPYSVTVTTGVCSATATTTVMVNAFTATAGPSSSTALVGSVVSLSATGGTDYLWSAPARASLDSPANSSDVSTILTTPGLHTFTVLVGQGSCSQSLTVDVNAMLPPDLTPLLYVTPSLAYSTTTGSVVVDVFEINSTPTSGTITVHIAKSSLLNLSFDPGATNFPGHPVQNGVWSFDGTSSTDAYILTTTQVIGAGGKLSVGLSSLLTPSSTKGTVSVTATLVGNSD